MVGSLPRSKMKEKVTQLPRGINRSLSGYSLSVSINLKFQKNSKAKVYDSTDDLKTQKPRQTSSSSPQPDSKHNPKIKLHHLNSHFLKETDNVSQNNLINIHNDSSTCRHEASR